MSIFGSWLDASPVELRSNEKAISSSNLRGNRVPANRFWRLVFVAIENRQSKI